MTLRVAIDARWLQVDRPTGVGRIVLGSIEALRPRPEIDLLLLTDARRPPLALDVAQQALSTPPPGLAAGWLQVSLPRFALRFDGVIDCPWYGLPYLPIGPAACSMHDLSFELAPQWFDPAARALYRAQARQAARLAREGRAVLMTACDLLRDDIATTYRVPRAAIAIVPPPPPGPVFTPVGGPGSDRYLVNLAGAPRRQAALATAAWRVLRRRGVEIGLVTVGGEPSGEDGHRVVSGISDADLARLLSGASAFVFPSAMEGWGYPGHEAMVCGTPVVALRSGALPEVYGDAPSWADTATPGSLADAVERVLADPAQWRERALAHAAASPTLDDHGDSLVSAYERAAGRSPRRSATPAPVTPSDGPELSVVVVTWNSASTIEALVGSLRQHPPSRSWELIVVDNASSDDTVERVRAVAPEATVIANRTNRGLAAANNQGLRAAHGRWLVVSNPDVTFSRDCFDHLIESADRQPRAGFVIPLLRNVDGSVQTSVGDLPTLGEALAGRRWLRRRATDRGFMWDGFDHSTAQRVGRGGESCYLVRREVLDDVGFQDERYFLDWEGVDWADRLARRGWEVWFEPTAEAVHVGAVSLRQVRVRAIAHSHRGMFRYFADRLPLVARPVLAAAIAARAVTKLAALPLYGRLYDAGVHGRPGSADELVDGRHLEGSE